MEKTKEELFKEVFTGLELKHIDGFNQSFFFFKDRDFVCEIFLDKETIKEYYIIQRLSNNEKKQLKNAVFITSMDNRNFFKKTFELTYEEVDIFFIEMANKYFDFNVISADWRTIGFIMSLEDKIFPNKNEEELMNSIKKICNAELPSYEDLKYKITSNKNNKIL